MMLKLMRIPRPALRRRVPVSPVRDSAAQKVSTPSRMASSMQCRMVGERRSTSYIRAAMHARSAGTIPKYLQLQWKGWPPVELPPARPRG